MEALAVVMLPGSPRILALASGALVALASRAALACPSCARGGSGWTLALLLGSMILTPYLVATVVLHVFRKVEAERAREQVTTRRVSA